MREKNLFNLLLGLNIALAAAFVIYLYLSSRRNPEVTSAVFPSTAPAKGAPAQSPSTASIPKKSALKTNGSETGLIETDGNKTNTRADADRAKTKPLKAVFTRKQYDWHDVETEGYRTYLDSLRAVGCPEDKVRTIILADINELFAQKRLKEAITHDQQWWRSEPELTMAGLLREKGAALDEARRQLLKKWLGEDGPDGEGDEAAFWSHVQLTGPVLGALPMKEHQAVQEICGESIDRYQSIFWSSVNAGQPLNQVDLANLRQRTRSELVKVLSPQALEEFLLRYSHNANQLRQELRGFDPTPEEFRKIFRVTDPIDHAMQLQYGGLEALSPQQRERHLRQRDQAIKEVLSPARYQAYLLTKDPLYRQAQIMAMQYGAPSSAVMPIYEMTKANESKRQQIMEDASLTPEQKRQALNNIYLEQRQKAQRIATEAAAGKP
jgi:hypothetical protein